MPREEIPLLSGLLKREADMSIRIEMCIWRGLEAAMW
jgi:hypothetical protein